MEAQHFPKVPTHTDCLGSYLNADSQVSLLESDSLGLELGPGL